jgi:hypothetical protein
MTLINLWPIGLIVLAVGGVLLALVNCAVADVVVHLAAWIYSADPKKRVEKVEEWTRVVADMKPGERPAHAASFLWLGLRRLPAGRIRWRTRRRSEVSGSDGPSVGWGRVVSLNVDPAKVDLLVRYTNAFAARDFDGSQDWWDVIDGRAAQPLKMTCPKCPTQHETKCQTCAPDPPESPSK